MGIFNNYLRVKRAKKKGELQEEYNQLSNSFYSEQNEIRKQKISGQIEMINEKNKIASEKNKKPVVDNSRKVNNFTYQKQNGINNPKTTFVFKKTKKQK